MPNPSAMPLTRLTDMPQQTGANSPMSVAWRVERFRLENITHQRMFLTMCLRDVTPKLGVCTTGKQENFAFFPRCSPADDSIRLVWMRRFAAVESTKSNFESSAI